MTSINYQALEGKTIGEILQIESQVKELPEGFKIVYQKPKEFSAQELIEEITK